MTSELGRPRSNSVDSNFSTSSVNSASSNFSTSSAGSNTSVSDVPKAPEKPAPKAPKKPATKKSASKAPKAPKKPATKAPKKPATKKSASKAPKKPATKAPKKPASKKKSDDNSQMNVELGKSLYYMKLVENNEHLLFTKAIAASDIEVALTKFYHLFLLDEKRKRRLQPPESVRSKNGCWRNKWSYKPKEVFDNLTIYTKSPDVGMYSIFKVNVETQGFQCIDDDVEDTNKFNDFI